MNSTTPPHSKRSDRNPQSIAFSARSSSQPSFSSLSQYPSTESITSFRNSVEPTSGHLPLTPPPHPHSDRKHADRCSDRNSVSRRVSRRHSRSPCIRTFFHSPRKNSATCSALTNPIFSIYSTKIENAYPSPSSLLRLRAASPAPPESTPTSRPAGRTASPRSRGRPASSSESARD